MVSNLASVHPKAQLGNNVTVSAFAGAEKITNPATQPDRKRFIGPNRFIVSLVDAIWSVRQVSIWFLDIRNLIFHIKSTKDVEAAGPAASSLQNKTGSYEKRNS